MKKILIPLTILILFITNASPLLSADPAAVNLKVAFIGDSGAGDNFQAVLNLIKNVGMLELSYPKDLEKTPGVFFIIANELAQNDISIIDALISSSEHIIIVDERDVVKAFGLIYSLIKK